MLFLANDKLKLIRTPAKVAELADAPDLGSGTARCGGSSPPFRTNNLYFVLCTLSFGLFGVRAETRTKYKALSTKHRNEDIEYEN